VADKLAGDWSPEQIAGWLKRQFPEDTHMRLSHETIYRSLFIQTRGVLKKKTDSAFAVTPHEAPRQACEYRGAAPGADH
jgi:IS30 family transposase